MAFRNLRLTDIDQLHSVFSKWIGRFEQLSHGRFDAKLQVFQGGLIRGIDIKANQRVLLRGTDASGRVSVYAATERNAASLWQGHRLTPGQFVVQGIDSESDHCSGKKTAVQGFSITHEKLEAAARALMARDDVTILRSWRVLRPSPDQSVSLQHSVARVLSEYAAAPELIGTPDGDRLEELCVRALVDAMFAGSTLQLTLATPVRTRLLRKAEEVMRARFQEPISAVELCREVGASDRTLRLAFRERYGLGPMAYYTCLRLNAVRTRLKSAPDTSVSAAATEFGFHHMGNFAAHYRRLFGERPVETRR